MGKAFEKQTKTIKDQGEKKVETLNTLKYDNKIENENRIPNSAFASDEAKKELEKILKIEKTIDREKLIYKKNKYTYDFRKFNTIRTLDEDKCDGQITLEEADKNQSNRKAIRKKNKKKILLTICLIFSKQEKWFLTDLK